MSDHDDHDDPVGPARPPDGDDLDPEHRAALRALQDVVTDMRLTREVVPCQLSGAADLYGAGDPELAPLLAEWCSGCRARPACAVLADHEPGGVWGGQEAAAAVRERGMSRQRQERRRARQRGA